MSVDFASGNTTRYYTLSDSADFTLPDSNWTWLAAGYHRAHTLAQYLISNATWGADPSFNLFAYSGAAGLAVKVNEEVELSSFSGALTDGAFYLFYAARRGATLVAGVVPLGATSFTEGSGANLSGTTVDSSHLLNIARRRDGFADRFWHGTFEYVALSTTAAISTDEALDLANGLPLLESNIGKECSFILPMTTAAPSTLKDIIGGKTATKNGTSYGSFEDESFNIYASIPSYISATLAGASTTVNIGQATETSSAFSVTSKKERAISQSLESDSAFTATPTKNRSIGLTSETDAAFGLSAAIGVGIGQATETDSSFGFFRTKSRSIGLSSEADLSFSVTPQKTLAILQAIEADTSQAFTRLKSRQISLAQETDAALSMVVAGSTVIGQALESDTAFDFTRLKNLSIGQVVETDTAIVFARQKTSSIGLASESDTAFTIDIVKSLAINQATETDLAFPFSSDGSTTVLIGQASESDAAFVLDRLKARAVGLSSETDTAFNVSALFTAEIGQASESDSAFSVSIEKITGIGLASEVDTAFSFVIVTSSSEIISGTVINLKRFSPTINLKVT